MTRRWILSIGALLAAAAPALARAAEEGHGEEHGPDWATLAIALFQLGILGFVLYRYAWPAIQGFFFQRSESIRKQLEQSQSKLRAAEAELGDLRRRLQNIDAESSRLVAQFTEQAVFERERAAQRAEQTARRIREEAQRVADRELERARSELRAEAAELAASLAADLLRAQSRPDDHSRLLDEFIAKVEAPRS